MDVVERYLRELQKIRSGSAGTEELANYGPLLNLLNEVGRSLKPRVNAVGPLKDAGAGHPDVGLFTEKQAEDQFPERGVIEVKGPGADLAAVVESEQVRDKYLPAYRHVLVTNFWSFVLVNRGAGGRPLEVESFQLAEDEAAFWELAAQPRRLAQERGEQLVEYLKRVMLRPATVSRPRDVAWFLASYARDALARVNAAGEEALPGLAAIRQALEETLGVHFEGGEGDRFFRSTMIQTLFYGIFSAWVLWHNENPLREDRFDWRVSAYELHVPVIQVLFEQLSAPSKLRALNLVEVLDWVGEVLNRVDRGEFFGHFEEGQAVQYFYEPFLEAFSPQLRKDLGVWYTPREVVQYMVERVDTVLQQELGIRDGLADDSVYVLDPAAGTGAYLVEVLRKIAERERAGGNAALAAARVKAAAQERVFGFELLPAPFVISHLQLGLLLRNLGAPLSGEQRAGVYLTNSLTGWVEGEQQALPIPEFAREREAAQAVKQERPILVILGNPPYNSYAGVAMGEERDLSDAYRETKRAPKPQGQGLNDLYVRFYRMAERAIVEMQPRQGIVCFISNYSWLDGRSFTGMRERYLEMFDQIWIDNLHGDRIISEYAPDGRVSETIFAMQGTSPGIKLGTTIALLVKEDRDEKEQADIFYRDRNEARAHERRAALLESLAEPEFEKGYLALDPVLDLGLPLKPRTLGANYMDWPLLPDLFPVSFPGVKTSRDDVLVDVDRESLTARMKKYFDPEVSKEEMEKIAPRLVQDASRFDAAETRRYLQKRGFLPENVVRYCYRPFDVRWLYWEPETKLLDEKRSDYFPHVFEGNVWLGATQRNRKESFYLPQVATVLCDHHIVESNVAMFPLCLTYDSESTPLLVRNSGQAPSLNISKRAAQYCQQVHSKPEQLFNHVVAVVYSPAYRHENAGGLRQDWPRIPLPANGERLETSAALGREVAALLNPEEAVPGVTTGAVRPELRVVGGPVHVEDKALDPDRHFAVEGSWGYTMREGTVTMPGGGTYTERDYEKEELDAFAARAEALGLGLDQVLDLLGDTTYDVYLNEDVYWQNVPANVWDYTIGGYQVIKKWLSYREKRVLGRDLRLDEVQHVTDVARRLAAIVLLQPRLDANYQAVKGAVYGWGKGSQ